MILASSDFGLSFALEWVALAIVVSLVVRYVVPWLGAQMNARAEAIGAELAAGEQVCVAAEQLVADCAAALEQAKAEAAAIVARARDNAEHVVAEGRARADREYGHALFQAEVAIDLSRAHLREEVIARVGALVVTAATNVVAAELSDQGHHRLIGEAIVAAESGEAS
ncbi:MAG TPA: hypothetical protein VED84_03665 [Acidimicrobiales bacterium]|nr:hypothetical protein [Acidimicrobiales bacterium]